MDFNLIKSIAKNTFSGGMEGVEFVSYGANRTIDTTSSYLRDNAIAIGLLLAAVYYLRSRYPSGGYTLSSIGNQQVMGSKEASNREEEVRRVRERQQKIANERAKEAALRRKEDEEAKRKEDEEAMRQNKDGNQLGDGSFQGQTKRTTTRMNDRNPLQPGGSGSSSYRPPRRSRNA